MWHYAKGDGETRSFDDSSFEALVRDGEIGARTLVWREGMDRWMPMAETDLVARAALPVPVVSGPPALPARTASSPAAAIEASKLQFRFTAWWVCLLAGIPLAFVLVGYALVAASVVFQLMLLHGLWTVVQDGKARTTPDKAVWLSFIPFFNLYWMFVAIGSLPKEMNRIRASEAPEAPECDENLGRIHCILLLCSAIPLVNILTGIAAVVTFFMAMTQCKRTAMGILEARAE